ncbi:MAG: class I SAM-dependent methyltransferase [Bacteroidota bacterium]
MDEKYTVGDLIYDANIYDAMNSGVNDLDFYKRWMPKNKAARVLELCCGSGRLTIPLAKEGYDIMGVDFTASMLEKAREKASAEGLEIKFVEADMRKLDLGETFDLIFTPFNSIHHLYENEDLFQAFAKVKAHLKEGGTFIFDCFNPNIQFMVEGQKGLKPVSQFTTEDGRVVSVQERMRYENQTQINRIEWHYFINGQFDSIQNLDMRMFYPQELNAYVKASGFTILEKFGSFEEEAFQDQSDKQIFVCN